MPLTALALALLLAEAAPVSAGDKGPAFDQRKLSQMSVRDLAPRLLGTQRAGDVQRFEVERDPLLGRVTSVSFLHRPVRLGSDGCNQAVSYVSLSASGAVNPNKPRSEWTVRPSGVTEVHRVALGSDCAGIPTGSYARVNPSLSPRSALAGLRNLASARTAVRKAGRLPFQIACRDETGRSACTGGARRILARLPLKQAWLINGSPSGARSDVSVIVGEPGQAFWEVGLAGFGTNQASVSLTRKIPAPF